MAIANFSHIIARRVDRQIANTFATLNLIKNYMLVMILERINS